MSRLRPAIAAPSSTTLGNANRGTGPAHRTCGDDARAMRIGWRCELEENRNGSPVTWRPICPSVAARAAPRRVCGSQGKLRGEQQGRPPGEPEFQEPRRSRMDSFSHRGPSPSTVPQSRCPPKHAALVLGYRWAASIGDYERLTDVSREGDGARFAGSERRTS